MYTRVSYAYAYLAVPSSLRSLTNMNGEPSLDVKRSDAVLSNFHGMVLSALFIMSHIVPGIPVPKPHDHTTVRK